MRTPLPEDKLLKRCTFESSLLCMEHQCQWMKEEGQRWWERCPERGREVHPWAQLKGWSMHVSKAKVRDAELIKIRGSDDRVHMWQKDKRSQPGLSSLPSPQRHYLISHSAGYVSSLNGDHPAPLKSCLISLELFPGALWLTGIDLHVIWENKVWVSVGD
jgi:hypothetical protein